MKFLEISLEHIIHNYLSDIVEPLFVKHTRAFISYINRREGVELKTRQDCLLHYAGCSTHNLFQLNIATKCRSQKILIKFYNSGHTIFRLDINLTPTVHQIKLMN